ncbi:hypothetical protein [Nonomuraea cypriaca]|uniref:hypothetical protein n=1 Tax=Nonomuraea cypriaca TaxID=1187855 RepID=UPI001F1FAE43|nr:hypothetical protein [Nonomuraea cypriaca]
MSTDLRETPFKDRSPLDVVERDFHILASAAGGLALDGRQLAHELPRRQIPLRELRELLASGTLCEAARDEIWRELVMRARRGGPQWLVGVVGTAVPSLRRICGRLRRYHTAGDAAYIDIEVLTAFIAAVKAVDLDRPNVLPRMCAAGRRAGERARQNAEVIGQTSEAAKKRRQRCEPLLADAVLAGDVEPALSLAITSAIRRRSDGTSKTSARSRITSDPKPITTEQKGGWGSPTGSARNLPPLRHGRWHHLFRGVLVAVLIAIILAAAAAAALAERGTVVRAAAVPTNLNTVFDNLRNWLIGLLAALATLMLTVGGLRYLVAGGDPGEVQKAKAALKAAAFGYGLAVLAPLFVSVLKRIVGGG